MYMMNDENMWTAFEPLDSDNSFDTLDYWEYNGRVVDGETPRKAFMTMVGDKPCIYDESSGDFLALPDGMGGFVTELAECEEVGMLDYAFVGYKYRATENGKWGYVSAKLGEILSPRYDGILTTEDGGVVAWAERDDDSSWFRTRVVDISFSQTVEHSSGASDVWLENFRDESGSGTKVFGETVDGWDPSGKMCLRHDAKDGISVYFPNSEESGTVVLRREDDGSWSKQRVVHYASTLELRIGSYNTYCKSFNAENALQLVRRAFTQKLDFEVVERDDRYDDEFIIRREGWYALADLYLDGDEVRVTYHTPFAFTRIEKVEEPFIHTYRIERFGKVGMFNVIGKEYIIPCEYEDIYPESDGSNGWYMVEKAGFTGKLDLGGRWVEHLHREEE